MRLGLGQIVVSWAVFAGLVVMTFLFGFSFGQKEGYTAALDEQGDESVRLPIVRENGPQGADAQASADSSGSVDNMLRALAAREGAKKGEKKDEENLAYDFSKTKPKEAPKDGTPATGLAAKPAASEVSKKRTVKSEPKKAPEPKKTPITLSHIENTTKVAPEPKLQPVPVPTPPVKVEPKKAPVELARKAPEPTKVVPQGSTENTIPKGWYIQVMAAKTRTEADSALRQLNHQGFTAVVQNASVKGTLYHRVLVGPYGSRTAAQSKRGKIKRSGVSRGEPFAKFIQ